MTVNLIMWLKFFIGENMNNNEIIPQYDVVKQNYSPEEKILL